MNTIIKTSSEEAFQQAGDILKNGGIVAFPTDTVYGLGAVFSNTEAVLKVFEAKGRDEGKPLSVLVSDISQVEQLAAEIPEKATRLMKAFWPGALTIILRKKENVPDVVTAGKDTIGIRMPDLPDAVEVIRNAESPLAAPSANEAGKRSSVTAEDVKEDLFGKIDMIVDGGACPVGVSSTIVDLTGPEPIILREGVITKTMIDET